MIPFYGLLYVQIFAGSTGPIVPTFIPTCIMQARLLEEMQLKGEAEAAAMAAEARALEAEQEKLKSEESSMRQISQLNRDLNRLRKDSDYSLKRLREEVSGLSSAGTLSTIRVV